jgi:serine/threonine protein kinase
MPASLEGTTLGKYRVLEPLGHGGMAQVYRAYHPQLDRYVAIKVLRSDLVEEEEFLVRFRREAQAVAALRHANIVQVHDFDVEEELDIYYMVMELLEGDTLKARMDEYRARGERISTGEMLRITLDTLEGLAYAHSEGVIHRDIKPANIMLTKRGQAVITDFGIAQIIGGTQFTVSGALMGTLSYMAPEQGLEGRTGVTSDIYSIGIVLYEMLTGRPPFDADTPLAILMKHVNDPLPLPRALDPTIPEAFERIVLKALAKRPEDRFQSAEEMAKAIKAAADESDAELPERIPAADFTAKTPAREAAPVAVLSGSEREKISEKAPFANEDTDINIEKKLAAKTVATPEIRTPKPVFATNIKDFAMPKGWGKKFGKAIIPALFALVGYNLMAVFVSLISRHWGLYEVGWPTEILLVSLGLCLALTATEAPLLVLPLGIILGNGTLLAFYSLTNWWNMWDFLWPLEPLLVLATLAYTLWLPAQGERTPELVRKTGQLLTRINIVILAIVVIIAALPIW